MKFQISAAIASFFSLASAASAETYLCNFTVPGGNGFVPREVLVEFSSAQEAMVTDGILLSTEQAPMKATSAKNTDKRMRVSWTAKDLPSRGGFMIDAKYSLGFNKKSKRADINLKLIGFDNTDSGNGTCKVVK